MNRDERKALAQQTLQIIAEGTYTVDDTTVHIKNEIEECKRRSRLITPEEGREIAAKAAAKAAVKMTDKTTAEASMTVVSQSTIEAIADLSNEKRDAIGVLNFASAKNAGGGFLNGSLAQEESLALSSNLYGCQIEHQEYYETNRQFRSMIYTDYAIFSPGILFFRQDSGDLLKEPLRADVLTLPAVNFGQVLQKGEDPEKAKKAMLDRMALSLALFSEMGCRNLVLGAYGCGVFQNDPQDVARWWNKLLVDEGYSRLFDHIVFAVYDRSKSQSCLNAFQRLAPSTV